MIGYTMTEPRAIYATATCDDVPIMCDGPDGSGCGRVAYFRHVRYSSLHDIAGLWMTIPGCDRPITRAAWMCECGREWWFDASQERVNLRRERLRQLAAGVPLGLT